MIEKPLPLTRTGDTRAFARIGYTDADTYGQGLLFCATGSLDAPNFIPCGSVYRFTSERRPCGPMRMSTFERG